MNITVPIYKDGKFNGNGFIYKNYLIAPAHVIRFSESNDFKFVFEDSIYYLTLFDVCYREYEDSNIDEIRKDLIILKTTFMNQLDYNFHDVEKKDAYIKGYKLLKEDSKELFQVESKVNVSNLEGYQYNSNNIPIKQHNVFEFKSNDEIIEGMSGSPIYYGKKLYGILLSGLYSSNAMITYHFTGLKASYIHKILQTIENQCN